MGHNQPGELIAPGGDKAEVWHLYRRPERARYLLQRDTAVHSDPLVSMAEKIKVHADLPAPPEGQEDDIATARLAHSKSVYQV
jgi:hypothetical protein